KSAAFRAAGRSARSAVAVPKLGATGQQPTRAAIVRATNLPLRNDSWRKFFLEGSFWFIGLSLDRTRLSLKPRRGATFVFNDAPPYAKDRSGSKRYALLHRSIADRVRALRQRLVPPISSVCSGYKACRRRDNQPERGRPAGGRTTPPARVERPVTGSSIYRVPPRTARARAVEDLKLVPRAP